VAYPSCHKIAACDRALGSPIMTGAEHGSQHKLSPDAANSHGFLFLAPGGDGASGVTDLPPPLPLAAHTTYNNLWHATFLYTSLTENWCKKHKNLIRGFLRFCTMW